jgi:hypothetical protein
LRGIGPVEKTLTAKLEVIAEFAGKFLLEQRSPLAGNTMLTCDPGCGGTLTQEMRADAQQDDVRAQGALPGSAPPSRDPFANTGETTAGQGKGQVIFTDGTVGMIQFFRWIIEVGSRRSWLDATNCWK